MNETNDFYWTLNPYSKLAKDRDFLVSAACVSAAISVTLNLFIVIQVRWRIKKMLQLTFLLDSKISQEKKHDSEFTDCV